MRELVTYVKATCDLTGEDFDAEAIDPVTFTWMGVDYELDVSPDALDSIDNHNIGLLVLKARVVKKKRGKRSSKDPANQKAIDSQGFSCGVGDCEVTKPTERGINSHRRITHGIESVQHKAAS